ncbi:hypothetical protein [Streptomyces sp. H39-S7]|uniref:hypothetical protein n=1 Tax=Streptomyces sp. H39-S7 TaxID=3004357 RepID=UPI0022AEED1E|nr:hypothetical protein [Streptomyces sp. H39-S7]MCZ4123412.1 hypothetical protein [Streptomyces sp. H39-S7]
MYVRTDPVRVALGYAVIAVPVIALILLLVLYGGRHDRPTGPAHPDTTTTTVELVAPDPVHTGLGALCRAGSAPTSRDRGTCSPPGGVR